MSASRRFWCSWTEESDDFRPLAFPPHEAILGWWCPGYDEDGDVLFVCVQATDEDAAKRAIAAEWPCEDREFHFIEEKASDWLPGERFPLPDWSRERFTQRGVK